MISKKKIVITTVGAAAAALLVVSQGAWTDQATDPLKFQGAWIAKVPGTSMVWTYTYAPSDVSARCAAIQGCINIGIDPTLDGAFPDALYLTPFVGEANMISPLKGCYTAIMHAMKVGVNGPEEVVYTVMAFGQIEKIGAGQVEVEHHYHIYLPGQTADGFGLPRHVEGDGIPGQRETPVKCIHWHSIDTRIPMFNTYSKNCGD